MSEGSFDNGTLEPSLHQDGVEMLPFPMVILPGVFRSSRVLRLFENDLACTLDPQVLMVCIISFMRW